VPELQKEIGVYILYRDDVPHYIGKSKRPLIKRLHDHANKATDRYFNLWNYFSVFLVDKAHVDDVERVLIAAFPTANAATPKIKRIKMPKKVINKLCEVRQRRFDSGRTAKPKRQPPD
jgi:predicted GIY-YIG superfamily endonuclease